MKTRSNRLRLNFDPRSKLLLTLLLAGTIVTIEKAIWLLGGLGLFFGFILLAGEFRAFVRWLRFIAFMILVWFIIAWLAFDLQIASKAGLRLLALTTAFFLYFRTTPPEDLGNALVKWGLPFEFAFIMTASLNFVPFMNRKIQNIVDAQRARGIRLEPSISALRNYPKLFVPLLVQSFEVANQLAEALEARGFGRPGRTFLHEYRLRLRDWAALFGAAALFVAVLTLKV